MCLASPAEVVDVEGAGLEVVLKVGGLAIHSAMATRQAFEVLVQGTRLEQARLNLIVEPLILTCAGPHRPEHSGRRYRPAGAGQRSRPDLVRL